MNNKLIKEIKEYVISIVVALAIALVFHTYVFARATVQGPSMKPTLQNNDILFLEKISTETSNVKRGEIVVFDSKDENGDYYIKRVIGIAGDVIEIKNGHVYLNGSMLNESYLSSNDITEPSTSESRYTVPEGSVFVLGDNRTDSKDSRILGPINLKDLKGHAVIRVFPFNKINVF